MSQNICAFSTDNKQRVFIIIKKDKKIVNYPGLAHQAVLGVLVMVNSTQKIRESVNCMADAVSLPWFPQHHLMLGKNLNTK